MITYKSSVSLIVAKEKENVEATIAEVTNRLANANENLTVTDVFDYLKRRVKEMKTTIISIQQ